MKRKLIICVVSAMLLIGTAAGATLAYFTDNDNAENVFTMGKVEGTLTETVGNDGVKNDFNGITFTNVKPGDVLHKDPTVAITSDSEDAYARVKIEYVSESSNFDQAGKEKSVRGCFSIKYWMDQEWRLLLL